MALYRQDRVGQEGLNCGIGKLGQYMAFRHLPRSPYDIMQVQTWKRATFQTSLILHMRRPAMRCDIHQTRVL
jgi:hypothetical protein